MRLGTNHIGPLFSAPLPPPQGSQRPGCQAWFGEIFSSRPRPPLPTPHLLPVLAAAGGPRDLLSDGAAEARGAAPNCLWKQFLLLGLGVCEIFSPVSLPPFSAATSGVLLSRFLILPRGYVCVCVCDRRWFCVNTSLPHSSAPRARKAHVCGGSQPVRGHTAHSGLGAPERSRGGLVCHLHQRGTQTKYPDGGLGAREWCGGPEGPAGHGFHSGGSGKGRYLSLSVPGSPPLSNARSLSLIALE